MGWIAAVLLLIAGFWLAPKVRRWIVARDSDGTAAARLDLERRVAGPEGAQLQEAAAALNEFADAVERTAAFMRQPRRRWWEL